MVGWHRREDLPGFGAVSGVLKKATVNLGSRIWRFGAPSLHLNVYSLKFLIFALADLISVLLFTFLWSST
jgi:hypothetical protein